MASRFSTGSFNWSRRSLIASGLGTLLLRPSCAQDLNLGGAAIRVAFSEGDCDVGRPALLEWIKRCANAVTAYFGTFPVRSLDLRVSILPGRSGIRNGRTFGYPEPHIRASVGEHVTLAQLNDDWLLTHEMTHLGFPSVADEHHWIEEGSATYIEPIARYLFHNLPAERVWGDMARDMPQGVPKPGEGGLDFTQTWASTYWGGALFCLLADVDIRSRTKCAKGLEDAFRAILRAGGNISADWEIERAFKVGDQATGVDSLSTLYRQMGRAHMDVDLPKLWRELGVGKGNGFDDAAPLAAVRRAIA